MTNNTLNKDRKHKINHKGYQRQKQKGQQTRNQPQRLPQRTKKTPQQNTNKRAIIQVQVIWRI